MRPWNQPTALAGLERGRAALDQLAIGEDLEPGAGLPQAALDLGLREVRAQIAALHPILAATVAAAARR